MKFLPLNLSHRIRYNSRVKHCHIFFTDHKGNGPIDYIYLDVKKAVVAYCDLSYSMFGQPKGSNRAQTESDMYKFILHPDHLTKSVIREGVKVKMGFRVCYECNMAALN
jgi:hypothetical protein